MLNDPTVLQFLALAATFTVAGITTLANNFARWTWTTAFSVAAFFLAFSLGTLLAGILAAAFILAICLTAAPQVTRFYDRQRLERLRRSVREVRQEWQKFPAGLAEVERQRLYDELEAAGDDFTLDPKFGALVQKILGEASLMLTLGSAQFGRAHGHQNQYDELSKHDQELQQAALDFLEQTKPHVIYAPKDGQPVPQSTAGSLPFPDIPLHDAIDRIRRRVASDVDAERELRDALSVGRLASWARAVEGGDQALISVPQETWRHMKFKVVKNPNRAVPFSWIGPLNCPGPNRYYDVQLSKAQIDDVWPGR